MRRPNRKTLAVFTLALGASLTLAACNGGGSSPTEPSVDSGAASASLSGSVTVGAQGLVVGAPHPATAGVTVRIQGTNLATTTDAKGSFSLGSVPSGTQVVVFETSSSALRHLPRIPAASRLCLICPVTLSPLL